MLEKPTGADLSFTAGVREAAGPRRHPTTTPLLQVAAATVGYYSGTSGKAVNLNLFLLLLLLLRLDTEWSLKRRNLACCGFFCVWRSLPKSLLVGSWATFFSFFLIEEVSFWDFLTEHRPLNFTPKWIKLAAERTPTSPLKRSPARMRAETRSWYVCTLIPVGYMEAVCTHLSH